MTKEELKKLSEACQILGEIKSICPDHIGLEVFCEPEHGCGICWQKAFDDKINLKDEYVYCTRCKHFKFDVETEYMNCTHEDECFFFDPEDGRRKSLRKKYEEK